MTRSFSSLRLFRTNEGAALQGDGRICYPCPCMGELTKDAVREIEQIHSSWIEFEVAGQGHSLMAVSPNQAARRLLPAELCIPAKRHNAGQSTMPKTSTTIGIPVFGPSGG